MSEYAEIINPSDEYTICVDDRLAACVAVVLIGKGKYALEQLDGTQLLPLFLFGGFDEWWATQQPDTPFNFWVSENYGRIADALDSVLIGDRALYEAAISRIPASEQASFRKEWQDKNRSSMNDIGSYAERLSAILRERATGTSPTDTAKTEEE